MTRWLSAIGLLLLVAGLSGVAAWSASARESDSQFVGSSSLVVAEGHALGLDPQRLASIPATLVHDPSIDPARAALYVARPERAFSADDRDAVVSFVRNGGTLLVADDVGQSNSLLSSFGLRLERVRLVESDPSWRPGVGVADLIAPSPTAIAANPGTSMVVLERSSPSSFLDRDGDGVIGAGDPSGSFPFGVLVAHGAGQVVVVADADALSGSAAFPNTAWIDAVLRQALPSGGVLLVVESRSVADPFVAGIAWLRSAAASGFGRLAIELVAVLAVGGLLMHHAWDRWAPHRFRPLRFVRRQSLAEPTVHVPTARWTARGAFAVAAVPALVLLFAVTGSQEAALACGVVLAALGVSLLAEPSWVVARRTAMPERVAEGRPAVVDLELARAFGHGEVEVRDHLPDAFELTAGHAWFRAVPRRAWQRFQYTVVPGVQGRHEVGPLVVRRSDLLGLRLAESHPAAVTRLEVLPRAQDVRRLPFGTRRPSVTLGPHRVSRAGDGSEFHALRTYQPGDPFRSVNWKASARSRDLMVNQRVHESMTRMAVFLDARALAGAGPITRTPLADSCRAVLAVTSAALKARDQVRIVVYGEGVTDLALHPQGGKLHQIAETMAQLRPAGSTTLAQALAPVVGSLRPGTPVLVASSLEGDDGAVAVLSNLRSRGLLPLVLSPRPWVRPLEAEDGGAEPEAERIDAERMRVLAGVRGLGIPLYEAGSDLPLDDLFRLGGLA